MSGKCRGPLVARPAPETPVTTFTTAVGPSRPAAASGARARLAAVALQPGLAVRRLATSSSRCSSTRPYTASEISSGCGCSAPYHSAEDAAESLKSAERSTTDRPASSALLTMGAVAPWGVAQKTTSLAAMTSSSPVNTRSGKRPARCGQQASTPCPAYWREPTATTWACGCRARRSRSPAPPYPLAPRTPTRRGVATPVGPVRQELHEHGLVRVQPVLGLVEHDAARVVDGLLGALLAVVGGEVVHEHAAGREVVEPRRRHRVAGERLAARLQLVLHAHRDPHVGVEGVGAADRLARVAHDRHVGAASAGGGEDV